MNIIKRRKILRNISALDLVPVRIVGHAEENGRVVLMIPKFDSRIIHRLFPVTEQMFFRIKLDDNGTLVWNAINGEINVGQLLAHISGTDTINNGFSDTRERLLKFISLLYERRYISFRQILN